MGLGERLQHAWNAFRNNDSPIQMAPYQLGGGSSYRPDQLRFTPGTERSIITAIYNRIAIDVAAIKVQHVRLDQNGRYIEVINDELNRCLTVSANTDQTGRALIQDIAMSLCDTGIAAIVPTDTSIDPAISSAFIVEKLRVGEVTQWFPEHITVRVYNELTGIKQEVTLPKSTVAIVENPLYPIMNAPNSTLRRLIRKLAILDAIDEQSGAGKLDLIVQLPYVIHSEKKRALAEQRRKDIEVQLAGSKYGIAYTQATEHITQLNRPAENNLMSQIEYLTKMLYSQLGITEDVMNGVADESVMLNYHNRTIEPMLSAITDEMYRKFLSKTARSQGQSINFFRDPFKLVPVNSLADIADKFTRNEILSSNEVRAIIGYMPVDDPRADELRNKNLNQAKQEDDPPMTTENGDDAEHSDEIEHHGIKGQKWGVRRGPPYPLEKNVGSVNFNYNSKYLNSVKNGAITFAKYAIAYTIPGAGLVINAKTVSDISKHSFDNKDYTKADGELEKVSQMKKQESSSTTIQNLKQTNPGNGRGRVNNCVNCVATMEMRERGYDVIARRRGQGSTTTNYLDWFPGSDRQQSSVSKRSGESRKSWVNRSVDHLQKNILAYGNNARGYVSFGWDKQRSGHVITWVIKDGDLTFMDPQNGKVNVENTFAYANQEYYIGRLDNAKVSDNVAYAVVSRGKK